MRRGLAAALVLVLGCRREPSAEAHLPAPSASAPGAAASDDVAAGEPPCDSGGDRCRGIAEAERCDGGVRRVEACSAGPCVAGGCVDLATLPKLANEPLLAAQGEGWIDAWTIRPDLLERDLDAIVATSDGPFVEDDSARRASCSPSGIVTEPGWSSARVGDRRQLLTGYAIVGRAMRAELRVTHQGRATIWVRGAKVLDAEDASPEGTFVDERIVPMDLLAGANPIAVALGPKGSGAPRFGLRIGAEDGSLLDLRWVPSHGLRCSRAALTRVRVENRLVEGGFVPRLTLDLLGLAPTDAGDLRARVATPPRWDGPRRVEETVLVEAEVDSAKLRDGVTLEATLPFARAGTQSISVSLAGEDGARTETVSFAHRGPATESLARLAARYLRGDSRDPRPADLPEALPTASRASFEHRLRTMVGAAEAGHPDLGWLRSGAEELGRMSEAIAAGKDPYADRYGIVHRAYRSPLDGRLQPYVLYVPPRLRRAKRPLPLVVASHGLHHDAALALRLVAGEIPDEDDDPGTSARHVPPLPDFGALLLAPGGYGDPGARTVGEADVLDAIEDVRALYPVDDTRVAISGYSLGGTVSFALPLHYPSRFAAAAPLCGYPNLMAFSDVAGQPRLPFEEVMLERRYLRNYVENARHLRLYVVHGGKDGPQRSMVITDRFRELGYPRVFKLEPELGHNVWDTAYEDGELLGWLLAQRRPERPDHVSLRTGELRYDRAFWVRLVTRSREDRIASIDARHVAKERRVEVATEGVDAFALDVTGLDLERATVDGRELSVPAGDGERIFVRGPAGFVLAEREPDRSGKKRPGVAGPLDDVLRHPLVIVYGTRVPAETATNRLVAEHWSSFDSWAGARFPVVRDHDVTDDALRGKSVVLVGRPETNALAARFADVLPVRFDAKGLTFRGERHEGRDVGISLIRPSPLDPDEYLVLHAGVGYEGTLASRHLPRLSPDFLVYDAGLRASRGGEILGARRIRDGGFFADDWSSPPRDRP